MSVAGGPRRGIISILTGITNGPYRYRAGPATLGLGVSNLAIEFPGRPSSDNFAGRPAYTPRRLFDLGAPAVPPTGQMLPLSDLRAGGLFLAGDYDLSGLSPNPNK